MMPGMHGDEFCRSIKENKETSWLPVILLTSIAPIRIRHLSINVRSIQLSHHIQDFIICGNFLFIPTDVVVYRCMEAGWR